MRGSFVSHRSRLMSCLQLVSQQSAYAFWGLYKGWRGDAPKSHHRTLMGFNFGRICLLVWRGRLLLAVLEAAGAGLYVLSVDFAEGWTGPGWARRA